jgi:hypothetical protein
MPNKFMQAGYGKPARQFLLKNDLVEIVDFGDLKVFEEANTYPCILTAKKSNPSVTLLSLPVKTLEYPDGFQNYVYANRDELSQASLSDETWIVSNSEDQCLLEKLNGKGEKLETFINDGAKRGVLTGLTDAFVIEKDLAENLIKSNPKNIHHIHP